jgi:hypothetical protein
LIEAIAKCHCYVIVNVRRRSLCNSQYSTSLILIDRVDMARAYFPLSHEKMTFHPNITVTLFCTCDGWHMLLCMLITSKIQVRLQPGLQCLCAHAHDWAGYPSQAAKEGIAEELGLTFNNVKVSGDGRITHMCVPGCMNESTRGQAKASFFRCNHQTFLAWLYITATCIWQPLG